MVSLWTFFSLVGDESTSEVYALMGNIPLISPTWQEFQYLQNSSKILFYTSLDGEPGPWSKAVLLPLNCFSLVSASPPFPNRQLLELRKGGWMKPKWGTQKGFCAQQPHKILLSITLSPPFPWDSILGGRWGGEGIFSPINGAVIIRQNLTPCWICFFYFDLCFSLLLFCL